MNKIKKIIITGIIILVLFGSFILYYNSFVKKVYCTRYGAFIDEKEELNNITFKFKLNGKVKSGMFDQIYEYETKTQAKKHYDSLKSQKNYSKKIEGNKVIVTHDEVIVLGISDYKRKDILNKYKEFGYECK